MHSRPYSYRRNWPSRWHPYRTNLPGCLWPLQQSCGYGDVSTPQKKSSRLWLETFHSARREIGAVPILADATGGINGNAWNWMLSLATYWFRPIPRCSLLLFVWSCVLLFFQWIVTAAGLCTGSSPVHFCGFHPWWRLLVCINLFIYRFYATCNWTCGTTWRKPRGVGRKKQADSSLQCSLVHGSGRLLLNPSSKNPSMGQDRTAQKTKQTNQMKQPSNKILWEEGIGGGIYS